MNDPAGTPSLEIIPKRRSRLVEFFVRLAREKPLGTVCGIIILLLVLVATFADALAPYPYYEMHLIDRLQGPSAQYLLGNDEMGRDLLSRLMYGARLSLGVGLAATTLTVVVALLIGGTSGFLGGKFDLAMQRFVDAWIAFPGLLILLTIMSITGRGVPQMILVLGLSGGVGASRIIRAPSSALKRTTTFWRRGQLAAPPPQPCSDTSCPTLCPS